MLSLGQNSGHTNFRPYIFSKHFAHPRFQLSKVFLETSSFSDLRKRSQYKDRQCILSNSDNRRMFEHSRSSHGAGVHRIMHR